MKASELSKKFLIWFQNEYPEGKIYRNNRGITTDMKGNWIRYGIPTPTGQGKKEKLKGSDYISWHRIKMPKHPAIPDGKLCISKFWEIKTKNDVLAEGQINFLNMMTEMGADCFVVHELTEELKHFGFFCPSSLDPDGLLKLGFYIEKWSVK